MPPPGFIIGMLLAAVAVVLIILRTRSHRELNRSALRLRSSQQRLLRSQERLGNSLEELAAAIKLAQAKRAEKDAASASKPAPARRRQQQWRTPARRALLPLRQPNPGGPLCPHPYARAARPSRIRLRPPAAAKPPAAAPKTRQRQACAILVLRYAASAAHRACPYEPDPWP